MSATAIPDHAHSVGNDPVLRLILAHHPNVEAIYLFGSYGTENEWPDSDVDLALLLPHDEAKQAGSLVMSDLLFALEKQFGKPVDLINLRFVSTVFQNEIIQSGRLLGAPHPEAMRAFEMGVLSAYQKLNEERREILAEFFRTKRAYLL